jgi:hypothetical protein
MHASMHIFICCHREVTGVAALHCSPVHLLQVERLASGTLHEPSLVVAALDVTSAASAPAFTTRVLGVTHLPAALLYPEGAPGCLLYTGRAAG